MHTNHLDTTPLWLTASRTHHYAPLDQDLDVDAVVVGGGITGLTAAYLLKRAGKTVALIERGRIAEGESGHTTAHLTAVTDHLLSDLVAQLGEDHAQAAWDAGFAAIAQVHDIVLAERIACDFAWVPGYLYSPAGQDPAESLEQCTREAELAHQLGFDAEVIEEAPFFGRAAVRYDGHARFHPRKYLAGLVERIPGDGCFVFEDTEVDEITGDRPVQVRCGACTVQARLLVMATHVPLASGLGTLQGALLQTDLFPYSSYVVHGRVPKGTLPEGLYWENASDAYDYLRVDSCQSYQDVIFGGEDHKTGQADDTRRCFAALEQRMRDLLPDMRIMHRWSGQVLETRDGLPYIGLALPGRFVATGFAGNGMTFGTIAGMMAADVAAGRANPWTKLFDARRTNLVTGAWNYLKENKDYPYYMIRDRFAGPDGKSARSIQRGEGKLVDIDGQRVAAYRDERGQVVQLSPACTHMGCHVEWNTAERTWDCPCHGSRFTAEGRVIAGPADKPLARLEDRRPLS